MPVSISDLPNEVLQEVLRILPPLDIPQFQLVCRRFCGLADAQIWRYHCFSQFRYWNLKRDMTRRYAVNAPTEGWKDLFARRQRVDRDTTRLLDSLLATQVGRIEKFQQIIDQGYDAKDCLLRHFAVCESAEDVLARRYYSGAALGSLHRAISIKEWTRLVRAEDVSLEKALVAFDMFVLGKSRGDFGETAAQLDRIAESVRTNDTDFEEKTPRDQALSIVRYLRGQNLTGIRHDVNRHYYDLQNNFMGIALRSDGHPSLPLISTAIFCCVARRLGLDANPCGFPLHVVALVRSSKGHDLNSVPKVVGSTSDIMYLDPFRSDSELLATNLVSRLRDMGVPESSQSILLGPSPVSEMVLRTARNIVASVQEIHRHALARHGNQAHRFLFSSSPDLEGAFYGAMWALLLLGAPPDGDGPAFQPTRRNYLPPFVEHFETHFPIDVRLIEEHVIPLFREDAEFAQLRDSVRVMRSVDAMPKQIKHRTPEISQRVQYNVGQVFVHKKYGYLAVITGWDVECGADEHWMAQMRVHELAHGKNQSFYHVLVEDKSVRYVAEENIEITRPHIPHSLMDLAGRHFKRWDSVSRSFVSNIRDEYPDN